MSAGFQRAARLSDLSSDSPHGVVLGDGTRVCLVRDAGAVHAFADRCPHRDFALSGGDLVEPCVIECPWHGARFDVRSGAVLEGPATDALLLHDVRIVGDEVFIGPRRATT